MTGLRLDIDLDKIGDNAQRLIDRCSARGISVTAVTKAMLGSPEFARSLECVTSFGDSRVENIERMQGAGIDAPMLLLRSPMPSQIERVVASGAMSVNSDIDVMAALSTAALGAGRVHEVMLMVELGDLREGVMPAAVNDTVSRLLHLPSLRLRGIGANLACRSGVEPSVTNMAELSAVVESVEVTFGLEIGLVSGGNSANLDWALGSSDTGRINNLRLGESILLGREPMQRRPIVGLHTDACTLVAEVIECHRKPTRPWGAIGQNSFGETVQAEDRGEIWQTILAVGRQDTEPTDLQGPAGVEILAASSDHLVTATSRRMAPGESITFEVGYAALLRSMTSPFVAKNLRSVIDFPASSPPRRCRLDRSLHR